MCLSNVQTARYRAPSTRETQTIQQCHNSQKSIQKLSPRTPGRREKRQAYSSYYMRFSIPEKRNCLSPKLSNTAAGTKCSSEGSTSISREAVHANCTRILRNGLPAVASTLMCGETHVRVLQVEASAGAAPGLSKRRRGSSE